MLIGKPEGKPKYNCPFCDGCAPFLENSSLYTYGDLFSWHQVIFIPDLLHFQFHISEICRCWFCTERAEKFPEYCEHPPHHWTLGQLGLGKAELPRLTHHSG